MHSFCKRKETKLSQTAITKNTTMLIYTIQFSLNYNEVCYNTIMEEKVIIIISKLTLYNKVSFVSHSPQIKIMLIQFHVLYFI